MSEDVRKRIKDWPDTATSPASDDYLLLDGATNGTRKITPDDLMDGKVDKVEGKGLSTEDYTTAEQTKLAGIEAGATKMDESGTFPYLVSGNLTTSHGNTDQQPYRFRKVPYPTSRKEVKKIVGGTVAWNQLVQNGNFASTSGWNVLNASFSVSSGVATVTPTEATSRLEVTTGCVKGHKYVRVGTFKGTADGDCGFSWWGAVVKRWAFTGSWQTVADIINNTYDTRDDWTLFVGAFDRSGLASYDVKNVMLIDLTTLLGSTIADYLYTLESSSSGSGIAKLREWGIIDGKYHAYDAGSLQSVKVSALESVGFNQWDEEWEAGTLDANGNPAVATSRLRSKNFIPILPSTAYFGGFIGVYTSGTWFAICYYDADKNFVSDYAPNKNNVFTTPSNAHYMKFYTSDAWGTGSYTGGICFNLSDPARNGTYEPYSKHSYTLDSDLTLRGVPKLDAQNNLYYDGDVYESDGTVTRKYGVYTITGNETWTKWNDNVYFTSVLSPGGVDKATTINCVSTKLPGEASVGLYAGQKGVATRTTFLYIDADAYANVSSLVGMVVVYELATPTTETADPFTNPHRVEAGGTEAIVDASVTAGTRDIAVPMGHETFYPDDLKARIEGLPDNFATLIAPVEVTYTATRNYTSGSLLIVNNILYKTTAAIANNGAITPGTNCQATTLAEIIAAL